LITVTRKDAKESLENLIRRFNKKVQQAGVMAEARKNQYFEKPISKRDRRIKAIIKKQRKNEKQRRLKLGIR